MPPSILSRLPQCLKVWKERTTHNQVGFPLHQALWPATLVSFSLVAASQQDWQSCSTELTSTCCLNSSPLVLFKTLSLYSGLSTNLLLSGWLPSFSPASRLLWAARTREMRPHVRMSFLKKNLGSKIVRLSLVCLSCLWFYPPPCPEAEQPAMEPSAETRALNLCYRTWSCQGFMKTLLGKKCTRQLGGSRADSEKVPIGWINPTECGFFVKHCPHNRGPPSRGLSQLGMIWQWRTGGGFSFLWIEECLLSFMNDL